MHSEHQDFRRRLWRLFDRKGKAIKYVMLEYSFKDGKRPSEIYDTVLEEKGGLMKAESLSSLPLHSQAANFKSAQKEDSQKDELWAIANLAKKEVSNGTPFVRYIDCCTGNVFLADDRQLDDLQRFCTNPQHFGVLGVDTVFNCGNFYATPTTYPHLLLIDKTTLKSPTMAKPALRNVLAVGSNGDSKIFNGMKQQFPASTWVLCQKHVEDNLRRYLTSIGITGNDQQLFIGDIFGDIQQRKSGLSDSVAGMQFGKRLKAAKDRWDQKERSIRNELEVDPDVWFHQMTPLQRQQNLDKLMSTEVKLPESQLQDDAERTGTLESHILWFKKTEFQPNLSSLAVRGGPSV
ncbi:unnamed protein product [Porites evermanni]|uniref:MULE transposase domain-containing protein n=1 Tax=Porites evermanni TaxID=104178 RepID=A0ABN8S4G1_9CNID|nr:unnamed protein product [Porites evermanni]